MSSAIRDVGETLINLLRTQLPVLVPGLDPAEIALTSPAKASRGNARLTLFLYSISSSSALRNEMEIPGVAVNDEPVSLPIDLYYLMTAFSPMAATTDNSLDAQLLLGHAMGVLFENGTLTGSVLQGRLPLDDELHLSLHPHTIEDLSRIWSVFPETVLAVSVSYIVTPVRLRATRTRGGQRVVSRQTDADLAIPIHTEGQPA